jgi:hypothetical protein
VSVCVGKYCRNICVIDAWWHKDGMQNISYV